ALPWLGDLDLGGGAAGGGDDRGGLLRWYRGRGAVDRDAGAHRFGPFGGAGFQGGAQPRHRLAVGVVLERAELALAGGAVQHHSAADRDAAELVAHRQRVDAHHVEVGQSWHGPVRGHLDPFSPRAGGWWVVGSAGDQATLGRPRSKTSTSNLAHCWRSAVTPWSRM